MLPDGRRQIMGFHEADELMGVTAAEHHFCSAEAVTPVEARTVGRLWLDHLLHLRPRLCLSLILSRDLELAQRHMVLLGRMTARERLCAFLLERLRSGSGSIGSAATRRRRHRRRVGFHQIELPMSRTDIADYLGLEIETVSRTITRLRAEGLIRTLTPEVIEVIDPGGLESVVQDRPAT
jgi:CRP/FNR family transcriptional regulator, anaerobic regulatory protein